ncbi:MAG: hypothetical protein PHR83_04700 [Paludibacter sp.]|nr:hypothetical protein [Paludibacter sp.]
MKQRIFSGILTGVIYTYLLPMIFYVPYYNWTYARDNGFVKWVLLGEVVATGKGFAWPYFVIFEKPKSNIKEHFNKSMEFSNEATKLRNQGQSFSTINDKEMEKFIFLNRKALEEALLIDIEKLNNIHPNFGNHFRDEYIKGLQLLSEGYDKHQNQELIQAQILLNNWGDWYSANLENIKTRNKTEVSVKSLEKSNSEEPKLNASELDRYSKILKKANEEALNQSDIIELRSAISDYTNRTSRKLTKNEYDHFIGTIKLSNDYLYELGTSLLYTWDQKKVTTTTKFDELYKTMKMIKIRKEEKLEEDMNTLAAAAKNQTAIKAQDGQKYEFSREIILEHMKQNELSNSNMDKIQVMMKEFVEQ